MEHPFDQEEQALIDRLQRAPQPRMDQRANQMLRQRLLDNVRSSPIPSARPLFFKLNVISVVAAGLVIVVVTALVMVSPFNSNEIATALTAAASASAEMVKTEGAATGTPIPSPTAAPSLKLTLLLSEVAPAATITIDSTPPAVVV